MAYNVIHRRDLFLWNFEFGLYYWRVCNNASHYLLGKVVSESEKVEAGILTDDNEMKEVVNNGKEKRRSV